MLNLVALARNVAADGNSTGVLFGPSGVGAPAKRIMPGETAVVMFIASDAFDGTVKLQDAEDGSTYADMTEFAAGGSPGAAVDLTTGKGDMYEIKVGEYMRLVVASRSAGSVSAFVVTGS